MSDSLRGVPILRLVPPPNQDLAPFSRLAERKIDRGVLIDISPDRENVLKTASIDEIRKTLALNVTVPASRHWLYRATSNSQSPSGIVLTGDTQDGCGHVLSADGARPTVEDGASLYRILHLDSPHQLISPRPLGPTHILVATETPKTSVGPSVKKKTAGDDQVAASTFLEIPVNDLLFALNVPNLTYRIIDGAEVRPLPQRVQNYLPRVRMAVPHLRTLPELVVYLHNKDQVELFSKLVPEWVRGLMHPLPCIGSNSASSATEGTAGRASKATQGLQRLAFLGKSNGLGSEDMRRIEMYLQSKAGELAGVAQMQGDGELLVGTSVNLDFLRTNLHHLGYFCQDLWFELDLTRELLLRTLVILSKVERC
ncbi:hypothetical protein EST38_g7481 [Candolleomyces aberdarensis]|uniref:Uncharacterized protein n=1 Tax=Candolleomyces aberdarensis TaxID=2316362 RepID=A0A4Q2DF50_9AGAR|nr:hypothetical protein EST38_g7481 [Candolleomyces aberdarensis]